MHLVTLSSCLVSFLLRLVSLTELDVSGNNLEQLPIGVGLLRHLRTLYADDNFLATVPSEVVYIDSYRDMALSALWCPLFCVKCPW